MSANTPFEEQCSDNRRDPQGSCKVRMIFMSCLPTEVISQVELKVSRLNPVHCCFIRINYAHFGEGGMATGELRKWVEHARRTSCHNGDVAFTGKGSQAFPMYEVASFDPMTQIATAAPVPLSTRSTVAFPGRNNEMMILLANRPSSAVAASKGTPASGASLAAPRVIARGSCHVKLSFLFGSMMASAGEKLV